MILGRNAVIIDVEDARILYSELTRSRDRAMIEGQIARGTFDAIEKLRESIRQLGEE